MMKRLVLLALGLLTLASVAGGSITSTSSAQDEDVQAEVHDLQTRVSTLESSRSKEVVELGVVAYVDQKDYFATPGQSHCYSFELGSLEVLDASKTLAYVVPSDWFVVRDNPEAKSGDFTSEYVPYVTVGCIAIYRGVSDKLNGNYFYLRWQDDKSDVWGPFSQAELASVTICSGSTFDPYQTRGTWISCAREDTND
jgi:hypothetical protein